MNMDKNIQEIPIEDIIPNRFQPRLTFNETGLNELAESIKQHGIIQPLVVRKVGDKFEIIAGERRYKASTIAGLTKVPAVISNIDDNKSAEVALLENVQRRNLTAIEEAKSYKNLLDRGYLTQEQLANKMGISQISIENKLRLLSLDEEVQDALLNEKISERHARSLLNLEKEEQKKWLKRIIEERLTVRQLDLNLKKEKETNASDSEEGGIPLIDINPNIENIVNNAQDIDFAKELKELERLISEESGEGIIKTEEPNNENKMSNKFFNFLEDEKVNMNVLEPEDALSTFTSIPNMEASNPKESDIEILDDFSLSDVETVEETKPMPEPTIDTTFTFTNDIDNFDAQEKKEDLLIEDDTKIEPVVLENHIFEHFDSLSNEPEIKENIDLSVPEQPNIIEESIAPEEIKISEEPENIKPVQANNEEITPFKSIFFTNEEPTQEETKEVIPVNNNVIEEITPVIEENIIDPMDSITAIDPEFAKTKEEVAQMDLTAAINKIRSIIAEIERDGINIEKEEADLTEFYHITIKINKNNN